MATAKTGSFILTETITLPGGTLDSNRVQGEIDLGAYVDVANGQAVAIESVDFIYQQGPGYAQAGVDMLSQSGAISVQLTDLNPSTAFVRADNASLIASGALNISRLGATPADQNVLSHMADLYPDNFGPTSLSDAHMVVNDSLYLVAGPDSANIGGQDVYVTVRITCKVAKLSSKDWMAIAIQSTASDN